MELYMELLAVMLALGATLCWGMDQVLGKLSLRDMDVLAFNSLRPAFAMLFVIPYALFVERLSYGSLELIALAALAGLAAEFIGAELYFYIMKKSKANLVIPIGNSDPLWASLLAILFLGEEARGIVFVSIAFVILGGFLLTWESGRSSRENWRGGLALAAFVAFLWGISNPITKYCFEGGMSMAAVQLIRVTVAFLGCNALMLARRPSLKKRSIPSRALKVTLISGFLAFFLGFVLWLQALKMEPASVVSPFLGGKAVFGFLFCALILKEKFTKRAFLGLLSILLGLLLISI